MKQLSKISFAFLLLLSTTVVFASGGESKKSKSSDPQQQGDKKQQSEELNPIEPLQESGSMESQSVDSTEESSVSKYNFIFHFLYKFTYGEEEDLDVF